MHWASTVAEPAPDIKELFPGLYGAASREFEKLALTGVTYPEQRFRVFEVSQSADRQCPNDQSNCLGTLYPNARFYMTDRCRMLRGIEEMHLQSLWFDDHILARSSDSILKSLAGNAFEASCSSAVFFVGMWLLASQERFRETLGLPPQMRAKDSEDKNSDGARSAEQSDSDFDELRSVWGKRPRLA